MAGYHRSLSSHILIVEIWSSERAIGETEEEITRGASRSEHAHT
jgi:hypothetical protein